MPMIFRMVGAMSRSAPPSRKLSGKKKAAVAALSGLIVLLVSLVQYLRASTLPKGVVFRNVLTIMVYSTFPAQIFATLFDAAGGGRFISFQLLFVCVFFFYQLFAFRAVLKKVDPQLGRNDRDGFDDDF